jgi:hypothetical protein
MHLLQAKPWQNTPKIYPENPAEVLTLAADMGYFP